MAKELPQKLLQHPQFYTNTSLAINDAFVELDKLWLTKALAADIKDGSTAVVVLVRGTMIYVANLGDSRAVICEDGAAVPLSIDHKPDNPAEKARIERNGGIITRGRINGKLAVSRSFGDIEFKDKETLDEKWSSARPDVKLMTLTEDSEFIVLGCDGLFDSLSNETCVSFVREKFQLGFTDIQKISEKLVVHAYDKGSLDNVSCIIVGFLKRKFTRQNDSLDYTPQNLDKSPRARESKLLSLKSVSPSSQRHSKLTSRGFFEQKYRVSNPVPKSVTPPPVRPSESYVVLSDEFLSNFLSQSTEDFHTSFDEVLDQVLKDVLEEGDEEKGEDVELNPSKNNSELISTTPDDESLDHKETD
eukprot:TRINITY_DN4197_c0_g1_i1.p1 TRINITY_DN4197_c0_g1~~TRINITY_DN4197_c0_g1_i1.p1  ORF type:complete len:416 (+),score=70.51 TRINITY_DN4197_c0_g1_i1:171-1250(+)